MTIVEAATRRTMDYIRSGMDPKEAVRRACNEAILDGGLEGFSEGWDTLTTWIPWILTGVAGVVIYRTGVKAHRAASDYIAQKKRKFSAAKAAWDAVL